MRLLILIFWGGIITVAHGEAFVPVNLPTTMRPALEINLDNRYKGRIHKCENEGISEIRGLNSPFEEFWAFLPDNCTWIELGILEEIRGTLRRDRIGKCKAPNTISGIKKADVIALMKEVKSLTLFHPHPTNKTLVEYIQDTTSLKEFSDTCISEARVETLEAALPSLSDLASMFTFSRLFYQNEAEGRFVEKLISAYGVTEYGLTHEGLKDLQTPNSENLRRQEMRKYFRIRNRLTFSDYADEGSAKLNQKKLASLLKKINEEVILFYLTTEYQN